MEQIDYRDRAEGWRYAKLSGHKNEALVKQLLDRDPDYAAAFLRRLGCTGRRLTESSVGGLHETSVPGVLGGRCTKSKTDLKLFLEDGDSVNLSIKKSLGGQVYLVRAPLLYRVFEAQFGRAIPAQVCRAMDLFWANAEDAGEIIARFADRADAKG